MLARERSHLAPEDDEQEAEDVERCEEGADRSGRPEDTAQRSGVGGLLPGSGEEVRLEGRD